MDIREYKKIFSDDFGVDAEIIDDEIKKIGLGHGSRVLDVGTGFGAMATLLALNGFVVTTGEPEDRKTVDHAGKHDHAEFAASLNWRANAKELGVLDDIVYQSFDAVDLPFGSESFDGVFFYDALQHIESRYSALKEALRVVKPGAVVFVVEWRQSYVMKVREEEGFDIEFVDVPEILLGEPVTVSSGCGSIVAIYVVRKR